MLLVAPATSEPRVARKGLTAQERWRAVAELIADERKRRAA
jgi:hypothetical protein